MVLGEYAGDYGCLLPKPVFIMPRLSPIKVWGRVAYENLKNKDTRCKALGYFRYRIRYNPKSIQRAVAQTAFYTITSQPER